MIMKHPFQVLTISNRGVENTHINPTHSNCDLSDNVVPFD